MRLSLSIIVAFLVLLPGFAFYGAIFTKINKSAMQPVPPRTGSILSLCIIATGALIGHVLLTSLISVNQLICMGEFSCMSVSFEPDIYKTLYQNKTSILSAPILLFLFLVNIVVSLLTFMFGKFLAVWKLTSPIISRLRYGAMASLVEKLEPINRFATAFLITNMRRDCKTEDDDLIGYEGYLDDIIYNGTEIEAVHISHCSPFYINTGQAEMVRRLARKADKSPIPSMYFPKDQIRNLAFNIYEGPTEEELADENAHSDSSTTVSPNESKTTNWLE